MMIEQNCAALDFLPFFDAEMTEIERSSGIMILMGWVRFNPGYCDALQMITESNSFDSLACRCS